MRSPTPSPSPGGDDTSFALTAEPLTTARAHRPADVVDIRIGHTIGAARRALRADPDLAGWARWEIEVLARRRAALDWDPSVDHASTTDTNPGGAA